MSPRQAPTATDSDRQKPQKLAHLRARLSVVTGVFWKAFPHSSRTIEARSCLPVERPSARLVLNRHLGCGRDPRSAQFTSFPFLLLRDPLPGKFHHFQSFPYRAQVLHAHLRRDSWRARAAVVDASSRLTGRKPVFQHRRTLLPANHVLAAHRTLTMGTGRKPGAVDALALKDSTLGSALIHSPFGQGSIERHRAEYSATTWNDNGAARLAEAAALRFLADLTPAIPRACQVSACGRRTSRRCSSTRPSSTRSNIARHGDDIAEVRNWTSQ